MKLRIFLVISSLLLSVAIGWTLSKNKQEVTQQVKGADEQILIGLSLDTLKEERWQRDRDTFVAEAERLGATVLVQSANSDDARQIQDVEALISRNVDVLVIIPHNGEAMGKAVATANASDIPSMAYDRLIMNCDLDAYLTFDLEKVGELQAQYLVDNLPTPGKGRIIRIYGSKTDNNAFHFKKGQDNILGPYIERGDIEVIHEDWAQDWNPENAKKIVNAAITQNGNQFDAILASNDGTAGGAVQSLLEEGLAGKILVTGQDADLTACQRIMRGTQSMTIYKPLPNLAKRAAQVAVAMAKRKVVFAPDVIDNGQKQVPTIYEDVFAVDKHNMEDTVIADGFHAAESLIK